MDIWVPRFRFSSAEMTLLKCCRDKLKALLLSPTDKKQIQAVLRKLYLHLNPKFVVKENEHHISLMQSKGASYTFSPKKRPTPFSERTSVFTPPEPESSSSSSSSQSPSSSLLMQPEPHFVFSPADDIDTIPARSPTPVPMPESDYFDLQSSDDDSDSDDDGDIYG